VKPFSRRRAPLKNDSLESAHGSILSVFLLAFTALFSIVQSALRRVHFLRRDSGTGAEGSRSDRRWVAIYSFSIVAASL